MLFRVIAVCVCIAVMLGCAKGTSVVADRIRVGDEAPGFILSDIFGKEQVSSGKVFHYNNATVVIIWSLACPDCREVLTDVQKVYEEYRSKAIVFLGVNFDVENTQGVRAFLKAEGIEFTTLWDSASRVTRAYKALDYTFSVFVVDRSGKVIMAQYDHPPDLVTVLTEALDRMLELKPE